MNQLTKNFHLMEFVKSHTATRECMLEQFSPPKEVIDNLRVLCEKVLQPLRDALPDGVIKVASGYRCHRLNELIGGKDSSQHLQGKAADIQYYENGVMNNKKIIETVKSIPLAFDQMIDEMGGEWVHISYNEGKNRNHNFNINH
jgi:zinc D-Ala-D-Ala carboxypeptidase